MWSRTGMHEWKHSCGWVIERRWTSTKGVRDYFPCYLTEQQYHEGDNFTSAASLKAAKSVFPQEPQP